jgi:hypothetical protein
MNHDASSVVVVNVAVGRLAHGALIADQGCQIFLDAIYQNGKNIPDDHKLYQMAVKYSKWS